MELTNAAVNGRIAELTSLAAELRVARVAHAAAATASSQVAARTGPGSRLGDLLIGLGTALGGRPVQARR